MTEAILRWRPLAEHDLAEARSLSEHAVAPWLQAWCDDAPRVDDVERIAPMQPPPWPPSGRIWACGPHVRWSIQPSAFDRLVHRALDLSDGFAATESDVAASVLRAFEQSMVDEMVDALRAVCGEPAPAARLLSPTDTAATSELRHGGIHVRLALGPANASLSIAYAAPFWWGRRASGAITPAPPARPAALTPRAAAIDATRTRVHARIGCAALPIAQLLDLAPGDVIVVADGLDPSISIEAGGAVRSTVGVGHLGRVGEQLSVQLHSLAEPKEHP
ncbi:FliM/FliN family flagellar motor C-terminal domain-containing protein [Burkholderia stagnalis]|uniref:FliM/FliN family flagellar motor C-terminal domain-containing protein n=1 Tax=Burkholderia stagnalis TaxID=1503054 RepID=UPI002AB58A20|nr:FliM/FliN family flagellar motor C-terminal domain-containing protein [Burkholderia stagnalis]MDY7804535.1 FliM/FliN family flagellar motor C-terminal domain-containing protein [Burkholderia stagnalis]